jgi:hypothetical protein
VRVPGLRDDPSFRLTRLHSDRGELRLVARLASVYHNSIVQTNTATKDLDREVQPSPTDAFDARGLVLVDESSTLYYTDASDGDPESDSWDDEEFGDRAYNDQDFELNEELGQPWNERGDAAEERWGLWG